MLWRLERNVKHTRWSVSLGRESNHTTAKHSLILSYSLSYMYPSSQASPLTKFPIILLHPVRFLRFHFNCGWTAPRLCSNQTTLCKLLPSLPNLTGLFNYKCLPDLGHSRYALTQISWLHENKSHFTKTSQKYSNLNLVVSHVWLSTFGLKYNTRVIAQLTDNSDFALLEDIVNFHAVS